MFAVFARIILLRVPAASEMYTLSLHDALPISTATCCAACATCAGAPSRTPSPCAPHLDRKSTRLNSSHLGISYAVFCLKQKTRLIDLVERRLCPAPRQYSPPLRGAHCGLLPPY